MASQLPHTEDSGSEPTASQRQVSLVYLAVLVAVIYALQNVMIVLRNWLNLDPGSNLFKLEVIAVQIIGILLPVTAFMAVLRLKARPSLGLYTPRWGRTVPAVALGLALIYIINYFLPRLIAPAPEYVQTSGSIVSYGNLYGLGLVLLAISVAAPFADEFFFRGILLRSLLTRYGAVAAILVTSLLTALFHSLDPFKLTHSFIMGAIFASAVIWTGSVYTSVILHALHNALSLFSGT